MFVKCLTLPGKRHYINSIIISVSSAKFPSPNVSGNEWWPSVTQFLKASDTQDSLSLPNGGALEAIYKNHF